MRNLPDPRGSYVL